MQAFKPRRRIDARQRGESLHFYMLKWKTGISAGIRLHLKSVSHLSGEPRNKSHVDRTGWVNLYDAVVFFYRYRLPLRHFIHGQRVIDRQRRFHRSLQLKEPMSSAISFSITADAAWAPGVECSSAWSAWANGEITIAGDSEPPINAMAPMLRRRAGALAKMALETAYLCLGDRRDIPIVFCSRHGGAHRSVAMLSELATSQPLSLTSFGLSVHNAVGGLFSIARDERVNHVAVAAGNSSVEHSVIEACGLLIDGAAQVLLVVYACPLPPLFTTFQECHQQPFAWAWLIEPAAEQKLTLTWETAQNTIVGDPALMPGGLEILRFYLRRDRRLERWCNGRKWIWKRDV